MAELDYTAWEPGRVFNRISGPTICVCVAFAIAITLWSAAILKGIVFARGLGRYGCFLGPVSILAVLSGHIRLDVHGFGLIVLGQAAWFIAAGVQLWRTNQTPEAATSA